MKRFNVEKAENGFVMNLYFEVEKDGFFDYEVKQFVFDSPAKLRGGIRAVLDQFTQKGE